MAVFMKIKYFSYKIARSNTGWNPFVFSLHTKQNVFFYDNFSIVFRTLAAIYELRLFFAFAFCPVWKCSFAVFSSGLDDEGTLLLLQHYHLVENHAIRRWTKYFIRFSTLHHATRLLALLFRDFLNLRNSSSVFKRIVYLIFWNFKWNLLELKKRKIFIEVLGGTFLKA